METFSKQTNMIKMNILCIHIWIEVYIILTSHTYMNYYYQHMLCFISCRSYRFISMLILNVKLSLLLMQGYKTYRSATVYKTHYVWHWIQGNICFMRLDIGGTLYIVIWNTHKAVGERICIFIGCHLLSYDEFQIPFVPSFQAFHLISWNIRR